MISRKQEWFANLEEGGRSYRLERRSNKAGNYLYCSVRDAGWKRFGICIPEGRGLVRGWKITAEKLRSLGVGLKRLERQKTIVREEIMAPETSVMDTPKSFAEAVKGAGFGITEEVIRVRVGKTETVERLGQKCGKLSPALFYRFYINRIEPTLSVLYFKLLVSVLIN